MFQKQCQTKQIEFIYYLLLINNKFYVLCLYLQHCAHAGMLWNLYYATALVVICKH